MTTTPARPTFIQTRVGLACPAPRCNKTYVYKAAAQKHWDTHHGGVDVITPEPDEPETDQGDDEEEFSPEVEALHAMLYGPTSDQDADDDEQLEDDDEQGERPDGCCGACPPIKGGGYDCTCSGNPRCGTTLGEALAEAPVTTNGVQSLTPDEIHERTGWPCRIDPDAVLALSDATTGLVDAITRLVAAGFDRNRAVDVVTDLIDKLHDAPTPEAAA